MGLFDNPFANLALGLASIKRPGMLGQAIQQREREREYMRQGQALARQAEEDRRRREREDFLFQQQQRQAEQQENLLQARQRAGSLLGMNVPGAQLPVEDRRSQAMGLLAQAGDPAALSALLQPKEEKFTKDIQAYREAQQQGLIPQGTSFEQFMGMVKKPLIQQTTREKPFTIAELSQLQLNGKTPPLGLLPSQAAELGVTIKEKPVAAESAGKQAMIDTALQESAGIENILFPQGIDGPINRKAIRGMAIKTYTPGFMQPLTAGVSEEGQTMAQSFEIGVQAITRLETGAAMPPSETDNSRRRFQPMPWDSGAVVKQKWLAYSFFLNNAKKYFDPNLVKKAKETGDATDAVNDAIDKALVDAAKTQSNQPPFSGLGGQRRPPLSSFER